MHRNFSFCSSFLEIIDRKCCILLGHPVFKKKSIQNQAILYLIIFTTRFFADEASECWAASITYWVLEKEQKQAKLIK